MDNEKPLILITNDDTVHAKGLMVLVDAVRDFGDIVVMSSDVNGSGMSHALTSAVPLRTRTVSEEEGLCIYSCNGTPVDCFDLGAGYFSPRRPSLVLSGINNGSNASVNVVYSGTMGAVIEASMKGYDAIGFSLLNHDLDADFSACVPIVRKIVVDVLKNGLPKGTSLNVNIPDLPYEQIKGMRVCRQSQAFWADSHEKRTDPVGRPYWWLTGEFICDDREPGSDIHALDNGYVSIVPTHFDYTDYNNMKSLQNRFNQ